MALAAEVWESGSYWHLGQQPAGQLAKLRPNWARLQSEFGFPADWGDLGARLERVALQASMQAHGLDANQCKVADWPNSRHQTLIHGDPKAPNFFFQEVSSSKQSQPQQLNVGIIDMQWCGLGLGAVDVAYCIAASADASVFVADAGRRDTVAIVGRYVREYYECLLAAFVKYGNATDSTAAAALLPMEVFQVQFEWAWIDLARVVVGDHWGSLTKAVVASREGKMSFNAYNKCTEVGRAVMELADAYLRRREAVPAAS